MYLLSSKPEFPHPSLANKDGILAIGGDLSPERLLLAYRNGIFPWYNEEDPILWWSPDPRMVVTPAEVHISKSMRKLLREQPFTITYNQCFEHVMNACKQISRKDQDDTWITGDMVAAYARLHQLGYAQSVEVWHEDKLVGGLYGIVLEDKGVFCGESMFALMDNASKYGFITLAQKLHKQGFHLIDCQVYTEHLASLGAKEIPRAEFLNHLS